MNQFDPDDPNHPGYPNDPNHPGYPNDPNHPGYPNDPNNPQIQYVQQVYVPRSTSGLAIASMVLGILWLYWVGSILAVIFGHVAISQCNRDPNIGGKGMAIAGVVLGWIGVVFLLITIVSCAAFVSEANSHFQPYDY